MRGTHRGPFRALPSRTNERMNLFDTRRTLAAMMAAAAVLGAAEARAQTGHHHGHSHAAPARPAKGDSARAHDADVRFMQHMIAHHGQALVMSRLAPTHAASNPVRILAARIENAQQDEIALMQQWLRSRGQEAPGPHDHADHADMPGMLTPAQLRELEAARGEEFDRLFLTYMIQHHRGAVAMVTELFSKDGAGQDDAVFKLASDVNVDQITEIARMQRLLADVLLGTP